ncbi:MAG: hypothetical protein WC612_05295 [Bdellovibrionales bacterium]|jgi:hypothetical protein
MKTALKIGSMAMASFILFGCMHDEVSSLPPGKYQQSSRSTDSVGTERSVNSTTDVYYDEDGNKKATIDKTTSTDPEGLFNKSTTETHTTVR